MYQLRRTTITTLVHSSLPLFYCLGLSLLNQSLMVVCSLSICIPTYIDTWFVLDQLGYDDILVDGITSYLSVGASSCVVLVS